MSSGDAQQLVAAGVGGLENAAAHRLQLRLRAGERRIVE
jgi:hypothetical protein